ncbi:MAG: HAD superfamily hydrolase (TIGR01549 family) [Moritella sp.]|jgi:HAD superfamily hydrolase (TIGR01549 family)
MKFYRRMHEIKAISFDLDDTLYDNHPVIRTAEAWMQAHLLTEYPHITALDKFDWQQLKRKVLHADPALQHDVSAVRIACLTQLFIRHDYSALQAGIIAQDIFTRFLAIRSDFQVPDKTLSVLETLANKVPLIALTNGNVDTDQIGLTPYFDAIFKAGEGRRMKPYPDLFHAGITELAVPPQHILHVGDHLISDVAGAVTSGLMAAWFNDQAKPLIHNAKVSHLPDIEISDLDELISLL